MQPVTTTIPHQRKPYEGGGRIASPAYRRTLGMAADFSGLEEGVDRYQLLLLVKRVGKQAGFSPRMISLLDHYLAFTRDCDWEQGSRPIVFQSLSRTALDLGISERQVQKLEAALFSAGALSWHDSGNHKRYGQRCPQSGRLLYGFGVDLTPLAYLKESLEAKLQEKRLYDEAWLEAKRRISWLRRQVRAHLAEWEREEGAALVIARYHARYEAIAVQIRTHLDLADLRTLLVRHEALERDVRTAMGLKPLADQQPSQRVNLARETTKHSCTSERKVVHYKSTNQEPLDSRRPAASACQKSVAAGAGGDPEAPSAGVRSSGVEHVTLAMAMAAAGPRLREHLPTGGGWDDLVEAAYALRARLGVSQASWGEGCQALGRTGAALCLLVTDRASDRADDPVRVPAAYFRAMVARAASGELRLHNSVFGLLRPAGAGA